MTMVDVYCPRCGGTGTFDGDHLEPLVCPGCGSPAVLSKEVVPINMWRPQVETGLRALDKN